MGKVAVIRLFLIIIGVLLTCLLTGINFYFVQLGHRMDD
jgi:hypothetical protein